MSTTPSGGRGDRARRAAVTATGLSVLLSDDSFIGALWAISTPSLPASAVLHELTEARDILTEVAEGGDE
jgi:hypothetical protein